MHNRNRPYLRCLDCQFDALRLIIQSFSKPGLIRLALCLIIVFPVAQASPPQAAIASAHPLATEAGFEILEKGGNAFDAAVAVSAALAVVEPAGSGLGGGGFWLLHRAADGKTVMLDGRERAPLEARPDMYLDEQGKPVPDKSINGALSAGIPGMPAALVHLSEHYGRLPLTTSLAPAIRYAENGFPIGKRHHRLLSFRVDILRRSKAASDVFLIEGNVPDVGTLLVQKDLANTLKQLATSGKKGFYNGDFAKKLVEGVRNAGGIWTLRDLSEYRVVERQPIQGFYRGIRITAPPPPSAGGVGLIEMLNILSGYDLQVVDESTRKHLIVEAMRRAYHDRERFLGDPDFVTIPLQRLISPNYAAGLRASIRPDRALPSDYLSHANLPEPDGENTTHFSILDKEGNRVSATLSINYPFGSGFMVPGTGVLLNDEMDDFAAQPGTANVYGLVGGQPNTIAPGKRMLSSMTPLFVEDAYRIGIMGTPGGSRIVSMMLLAVLDFAEGRTPESWVAVPRFHHQYLPDVIQYEPSGLTENEQAELKKRGHKLKAIDRRYGDMQAVLWNKSTNRVYAASDPRGEGLAKLK
ncbi:gamma-glutamyltransferase [Methylocaldum szegediense]|uniref:Glutathione hydrolase proenzyme n=1 Tax=Methylocaldum szegediense TaxID=73780 RepID=A0ABN8X6E2_9GAMM|nr:gamma-glutamyltransferase [Methylocaldum szegediense]CAI8906368.1 Glutathione hydrolase proenzyme [Methylocaldum szegediense]